MTIFHFALIVCAVLMIATILVWIWDDSTELSETKRLGVSVAVTVIISSPILWLFVK